jgi:hypothetical protein
LLAFFNYNVEPTNFFPDVKSDQQGFKDLIVAGKPGSIIRINGNDPSQEDINIRSKEGSDPKDIPEG